MKKTLRKFALLFSAGAVGGFANSIAVWAFGKAGINAMLGVSIAPELTPAWLYPRLVWGGLWGALFLLLENGKIRINFFLKAFVASLGPTLVMFFIVFPIKAGKGYMGLDLGVMTPALVVLFNFIWAITTLKLYRYLK